MYQRTVYQRKTHFLQNSHKMPQSGNKRVLLPTEYALIPHFRRAAPDMENVGKHLDTENDIKYNEGCKNRKRKIRKCYYHFFSFPLPSAMYGQSQ